MHYILDGYNFLFRLSKTYKVLIEQKKQILSSISKWVSLHKIRMTFVFDSKQKDRFEAIRSHLKQLEIIYTPTHQSADDYIIQLIEKASHPAQKTVVSSDREVTGKAKQLGAKTQTIEQFLSWIVKKKGKKRTKNSLPSFQETPFQKERLLKIFEEKFLKEEN